MRDLSETIDKVIALIPESEEDLIRSLRSRQDSVHFSPPELMSQRWLECSEILGEELGNPPYDKDWKAKVLNLWIDNDATNGVIY